LQKLFSIMAVKTLSENKFFDMKKFCSFACGSVPHLDRIKAKSFTTFLILLSHNHDGLKIKYLNF
jgi:hypothetical protein